MIDSKFPPLTDKWPEVIENNGGDLIGENLSRAFNE